MSQFKEKHFNNNHHSSLQPGCKAKKCGVCFPLTSVPPTLYQHPFFPPKHEFRYEGDETLLSSTLTLTWDPHKQLVNIFRKDNLSWEGKVFSFQKLAGKKKKKTMKQSKGPSRLAQFGGFNGKKQPFIIRQIPLFTSWKARFPIWRKFHVCFLALEPPYLWVIQT